MASLKDIRLRIASVQSTKKITSAMKMVSAAKLRKAQDAILQMRPYAEKLHEILTGISSSLESSSENVFSEQRDIRKVLLVVITSNSSLCGAFNANVIKKSLEVASKKFPKQYSSGNLDFYTIGKTGFDTLKKGNSIFKSEIDLYSDLKFDNVAPIATELMGLFAKGEYDYIEIVYNQFKNAAVQILTEEQYLPVNTDSDESEVNSAADYIFEPTKEYIVEELIPKSLKIQLYKALLDSFAAEHGARMTAMHKATDNATELIKSLNLEYNKARQAAITNEILEIVSGAEALKG